MVIKGSARGGAGELAAHLLRVDTNEVVNVLQFSDVASLDVPGALAELDAMGAGSRSSRTLYHASINTPVSEQLTPEQQVRARERLAAELGLAGQPFVVVEHVKHGRQHTHVVWSRIDVMTARAIPDSHNYRRHERVSRELEQEFGHERVLGAHERDKQKEKRPERGPSWGEQRQAERSGLTPADAKAIVSEAWRQTTTGTDFRHLLEAEGFTLARGDRRDFVLIDPAGELHGLTRRIEGVRAAQVRERMADVDPDQLPDVAEARRRQREQQQAQENAASFGVTGIAERIRADELRREAEARTAAGAALSGTHQDISDALYQLQRTMRSEIQVTLAKSAEPARPYSRISPQIIVPEPKPTPPAKEDLYDRVMRERAQRSEAEKAADRLRRQEKKQGDRSRDFEP